jgi:hypothetical protein
MAIRPNKNQHGVCHPTTDDLLSELKSMGTWWVKQLIRKELLLVAFQECQTYRQAKSSMTSLQTFGSLHFRSVNVLLWLMRSVEQLIIEDDISNILDLMYIILTRSHLFQYLNGFKHVVNLSQYNFKYF